MSKSANSSRTATLAAVFLVLVICQIVTSAPLGYDYDNIRDLYEYLLRQEGAPSQFVHQMERKGGRNPTLRLRFGRRSDPLWSKMSAVAAKTVSDDNVSETVPYK